MLIKIRTRAQAGRTKKVRARVGGQILRKGAVRCRSPVSFVDIHHVEMNREHFLSLSLFFLNATDRPRYLEQENIVQRYFRSEYLLSRVRDF